MSRITLYTPGENELDYRARLLGDPTTMYYNKELDLDIPGYHKDTGCIDFPESARGEWYARWIGSPDRFYAYVRLAESGEDIGEVCAKNCGDHYEIGIVIESRYRGCKYGTEAMNALLTVVFDKLGVAEVQNEFDFQHNAAARLHCRAHFTPVFERKGYARCVLKREIYETLK